MNKVFKFISICFLMIFNSCSNNTDDEVDTVIYYNKISCNGVQILDESGEFLTTRRLDDYQNIYFVSYIPESAFVVENRVNINFDLYGNFGNVSVQKESTVYKSFLYDSSANFNFVLDEYDSVNNAVKGHYSGKLYLDPEDLNSSFVTIEGSFFLLVGNNEGGSGITKMGLKMNGADWRSTVLLNPQEYTYEGTVNYAANQFLSDDKYKIVIGHEDATASAIGTHVFDNTNTDFFVKLGKYNAITNQFDYYISSQGILTINTAGHLPPSGIGYFYTANFSFTSTNPLAPFDVINITDGVINYHD